jgi:hypothetical protein
MTLAVTADYYWIVKSPLGGFFDLRCVANLSLLFHDAAALVSQRIN